MKLNICFDGWHQNNANLDFVKFNYVSCNDICRGIVYTRHTSRCHRCLEKQHPLIQELYRFDKLSIVFEQLQHSASTKPKLFSTNLGNFWRKRRYSKCEGRCSSLEDESNVSNYWTARVDRSGCWRNFALKVNVLFTTFSQRRMGKDKRRHATFSVDDHSGTNL